MQGKTDKEKRIPETFVLKGPRINLLSPPTSVDDCKVRAMLSDSETMEFLQVLYKSQGWTEEEAASRRIDQARQQQEEHGLHFSIYSHGKDQSQDRESEGAEYVGFCGFRLMDLEAREGEFGIIIDRNFWGKGYATEALYCMLQYAFEELNLLRCFASTNPDNKPMLNLFTKYGMKRVSDQPRTDEKNFVWLDFSIYENEWPEIKAKMQSAVGQRNM